RLHALQDVVRSTLLRKPQNRLRLVDVFTADHIDDQPRLLGRTLQISCTRCCFHLSILYLAGGADATLLAFSTFVPEWPLNVRVGANSPSLWPTMFSVT